MLPRGVQSIIQAERVRGCSHNPKVLSQAGLQLPDVPSDHFQGVVATSSVRSHGKQCTLGGSAELVPIRCRVFTVAI